MERIFFLLLPVVCWLVSLSLAAQTHVGGTLTANTTWTAVESPYVVDSTLKVPEGITLTIEPGVIVKNNMTSYTINPFEVNGTLLAQGTASNKIIFTDLEDDVHGGDTNGDGSASTPTKGYEWRSIYIAPTGSSNPSVLSHCELFYGGPYISDLDYIGAVYCEGAASASRIAILLITAKA